VLDNQLEPLGLLGFPWIPLLGVAIMIGPVLWHRSRDKPVSRDPDGELLPLSGKS